MSWLVIGRVVGDALAFVFYVVLARAFGESGLGDYTFAFAVALLLATGVEFGFRPLVTRDVARQPSLASDYSGRIAAVQLLLALFMLIFVLVPLLIVGNYGLNMIALVTLAFLALAIQSIGVSFAACLEAIEAMKKSAILEMLMKFVTVVAGLLLIAAGAPLPLVMVAHILGSLTYLGCGVQWVNWTFGPSIVKIDRRFARSKLAAAVPFVGQAALYLLYTRVDVMMLHSIAGDVETGRYAGAMRLTITPLFLAYMVGIAIYPRLSCAGPSSSLHERRTVFLAALKWLALAATAGAVILFSVGDDILVFLLGQSFVRAGELMPWMAVLLIAGFVRVPYERLLFASDRERPYLYIEGIALAGNVALNLLLIPAWGARGAVWASIASQLFVVAALHWYGSRLVAARYGLQAIRLIVAGAAGLAGSVMLQGVLPWAVIAVLAVLLVLGAAVLLGLVSAKDREMLGAGTWRA